MLANILKVLLFFVVLRMLYPLFKGIGASSKRPAKHPGSGRSHEGGPKREYSDLTPYEIEDADFEEIRKK